MRAFVLLALGPCAVIALAVAEPSREEPADVAIEDGDVVPVVGLAPAPMRVRTASSRGDVHSYVEPTTAGSRSPQRCSTALSRLLPLRVHVVDAETGVEHRGATWWSGLSIEALPTPVESGAWMKMVLPHGERAVDLRLGVPSVDTSSFSLWRPPECAIARDTTSLVAVWPFAREADVFVRLTAEGGPVPLDWSLGFEASVAGKSYDVVAEPVVAGVRLRGLPFRRRARWTLRVTATANGECARGARGEMSDDASAVVHVAIDLPTMWQEYIGLGGGVCGGFKSCCGGRRSVRTDHRASVVAVVLRRDGEPADTASVRLVPVGGDDQARGRRSFSGKTDVHGRIAWTHVATGTFRLELREPGLVPSSMLVTVIDGTGNAFELREQHGATIDVVVQDENGDGVPFAELTLKQPCGEEWIDLVGGVQRLDRFVDVRGRRVLENVEPGEVEIEASYADRKGRGTVRVSPGDSTRLSITIAHE